MDNSLFRHVRDRDEEHGHGVHPVHDQPVQELLPVVPQLHHCVRNAVATQRLVSPLCFSFPSALLCRPFFLFSFSY